MPVQYVVFSYFVDFSIVKTFICWYNNLKTHTSNLLKHLILFLAQTTKSCNHGEITQVSSDVSCRSFYLCSHGHQMLMTCAPGTMFDSKCLCCNHLTMVSCSTAAASIMKGKLNVLTPPLNPESFKLVEYPWNNIRKRESNAHTQGTSNWSN